MAQETLYILYNADSTLMGKLRYSYRKLSRSVSEPTCAACDITHGGLSLTESPEWVKSKGEIQNHGINVVQWHRDEIDQKLRAFISSNEVRFPAVILRNNSNEFRLVMDRMDLNACAGKPPALVATLHQKGLLPDRKPGPSSL